MSNELLISLLIAATPFVAVLLAWLSRRRLERERKAIIEGGVKGVEAKVSAGHVTPHVTNHH